MRSTLKILDRWTGLDSDRPSSNLPEMKLLVRMLERAIRDFRGLDVISKTEVAREKSAFDLNRRARQHEKIYRLWKWSGMDAVTFCREREIAPSALRNAQSFLSYYKSFRPMRAYPSATQWIFSDACTPFSFRWVVFQLYGDCGMDKSIRDALLAQNQKNPLTEVELSSKSIGGRHA